MPDSTPDTQTVAGPTNPDGDTSVDHKPRNPERGQNEQELSDEEIRMRLLDFYSGKGDVSATSLLALAVVLFAALQIIEGVHNSSFEQVPSIGWGLAAFVMAAISCAAVYSLMRGFYWGALAGAAIPYKDAHPKEDTRKESEKMDRLAAAEYLIKKYAFHRPCNFTIDPKDRDRLPQKSGTPARMADVFLHNLLACGLISFLFLFAFYGLLLYEKFL